MHESWWLPRAAAPHCSGVQKVFLGWSTYLSCAEWVMRCGMADEAFHEDLVLVDEEGPSAER